MLERASSRLSFQAQIVAPQQGTCSGTGRNVILIVTDPSDFSQVTHEVIKYCGRMLYAYNLWF